MDLKILAYLLPEKVLTKVVKRMFLPIENLHNGPKTLQMT